MFKVSISELLALWNFWTALGCLSILVKINYELVVGDLIRVVGNFISFPESPRSQHVDSRTSVMSKTSSCCFVV